MTESAATSRGPKPGSSIKKIRRLPRQGWVAGVCAGIAEFADVDKMVVRALYVLGTIVTFVVPGTLAYVIMWAVIPPARPQAEGGPAPSQA